MSVFKVLSPDQAEQLLAKVFDILDSYSFDKFEDVFAKDLEYQGGLQKDSGLEAFTGSLKKQMEIMPPMKTSHARFKNDIAPDGTIYSSGTSTALFDSHPDKPVTIPMIGVFTILSEGPDAGKIKDMKIYKDRLPFMPFIQNLPGRAKN